MKRDLRKAEGGGRTVEEQGTMENITEVAVCVYSEVTTRPVSPLQKGNQRKNRPFNRRCGQHLLSSLVIF